MKVSFAVIGNNWGNKIYKILRNSNYSVKKITLRSPDKYNKREEYFEKLNNELGLIKKKNKIVWLAITPNQKDQFEIVKYCLKKRFNVILEKPWTVDKKNTILLEKLQKKQKVLVGFNFEYLYLNFFKRKKFDNKKIKKLILNFHVKNNKLEKNHKLELGSHLKAIKNYYFADVKNYKINTGFKKDSRKISVQLLKKSFHYDFTKNKEKIIQKFIKDFCKHILISRKFKFGFNFIIKKNL